MSHYIIAKYKFFNIGTPINLLNRSNYDIKLVSSLDFKKRGERLHLLGCNTLYSADLQVEGR
jgi:hypothetical protein